MWPPNNNGWVTWKQGENDWLTTVWSVLNWGAADVPAGRREAFLDLIAPVETSSTRSSMSRMSTCALAVLGMWRLYGIDDDVLWKPYRVGHAVTEVVEVAKHHNSWLPANTVPEIGDVVLIGGQGGGNEHVLTVTDSSHNRITSVDGGQVVASKQCILRCSRPMQSKLGNLWIGNRRVMGVCRMSAMVPTLPQWAPSTP
jgi:hypothetical protein